MTLLRRQRTKSSRARQFSVPELLLLSQEDFLMANLIMGNEKMVDYLQCSFMFISMVQGYECEYS